MSEGNILIEGKEYVSSDRAAKLVGYTKDYVGQLARAGKIEAKRIGRSWYIAQDSINKHKLSVHYILTKPKKSGRTENESDEIVNINIDNSPAELNPTSNQILKTDAIVNAHPIHNDDMELDLIPRLKEKKRDVLLHTDIKYEEIHDVPQERVFKDDLNNNVKSIPIRSQAKEIRSFSNHVQKKQFKVQSPIRTRPHVGGVVVDGIRKPDANRHAQSSLPKNVRREIVTDFHKIHRESLNKNEVVQASENSKVIPVIGAIFVFTVFVVIYMFISTK